MKAYKSELAERCTKEQLHEAVHGKKSQTKPLSNQEILKFIHEKFVKFGFEADYILDDNELIDFVRTIEERHGIK